MYVVVTVHSSTLPLDKRYFFLFLKKTYVVGIQKNSHIETVLVSTQNKCFNCQIRKYSQFHSQKFVDKKLCVPQQQILLSDMLDTNEIISLIWSL